MREEYRLPKGTILMKEVNKSVVHQANFDEEPQSQLVAVVFMILEDEI